MQHRVAAVLLAAGLSKRMGRPKQLLPLGNKPVIRHCVDSILAAGVRELVVVVGRDGEALRNILEGLPVTFAVNDRRDSDMAGSIRAGLEALDQSASGVLICLADHPLAASHTIRALVEFHDRAPDKIIIPAYREKRGHPSLFPLTVSQELFVVDTLRDVVRRDADRVLTVEVQDEGVVLDMDTPGDYEEMRRKVEAA